MHICFVSPRPSSSDGIFGVEPLRIPPLGLLILASLTPDTVKVDVFDEHLEELPDLSTYDLVGMTCSTAASTRAYEIADHCKNLGVRVALGGCHPSLLPEEALGHADFVFVGPAERTWPQFISEFAADSARRLYSDTKLGRLLNLPLPDFSKVARLAPRYGTMNVALSSLGCSHRCAFCTVYASSGIGFRPRPIEDVVRDLKPMSGQFVWFVDDNLYCNREYALRLFRAIEPLQLTWLNQASISIGHDLDTLVAAKRSGCISLLIGLESLSARSLRASRKTCNVPDEYRSCVDAIRGEGIGVEAAFIFGFDEEDEGVFETTLGFCYDADVELAHFSILTPFPGTSFYARCLREERLLKQEWRYFDGFHVVFKPALMSAERLLRGFREAYQEFYRPEAIARRRRRAVQPAWYFSAINRDYGVLGRSADSGGG
ncbi:MAG TPA: radical SAM protein [Phycisphaerae bacterium]|nr:radical SAM protein [Phycisphaerae bacterium]